ncbi:MAG TPA: helix-turn-helix domain-containing protein, partial [Marmoricola sp.]|nr:helix-turn-helix domain-containing protein [Marmoricola sp.]
MAVSVLADPAPIRSAVPQETQSSCQPFAFLVFIGTVDGMRSAVRNEAVVSESEDLLTTGEVAKILNSSRQHVVNLCSAGELPYTTVGKHRR